MNNGTPFQDESSAAGAHFCLTDVAMGLTMLDRAESTNDKIIRRRNVKNAQAAYDAVTHFLPRLNLPAEADEEIRKRLAELRSRIDAAKE